MCSSSLSSTGDGVHKWLTSVVLSCVVMCCGVLRCHAVTTVLPCHSSCPARAWLSSQTTRMMSREQVQLALVWVLPGPPVATD